MFNDVFETAKITGRSKLRNRERLFCPFSHVYAQNKHWRWLNSKRKQTKENESAFIASLLTACSRFVWEKKNKKITYTISNSSMCGHILNVCQISKITQTCFKRSVECSHTAESREGVRICICALSGDHINSRWNIESLSVEVLISKKFEALKYLSQ